VNRQSSFLPASAARVIVVALLAGAPLAAQSPGAASPALGIGPDGRYPFTKADVAFMQGMIGHHAQAVKMAGWATSHGASKSLQIYCGRVAMAQTAEIGLMQQWLRLRNQEVPDPSAKHDMAGMNMPGMAMHDTLMPGMLTPEQMDQLDKARGVEFDRLFLTFMIQHHRGAIEMVNRLMATNGAAQDDIVFKFANDVNADQSTEIDRMQQMLDALPPRKGQVP
jgi:uncharacterized protein (DUF305 family)